MKTYNEIIKATAPKLHKGQLDVLKGLTDNRRRILANMCFNLGYTRLSKFKNFLSALENQDWKKASEEMMDSRWAKQVGPRSIRLKNRVLKGD